MHAFFAGLQVHPVHNLPRLKADALAVAVATHRVGRVGQGGLVLLALPLRIAYPEIFGVAAIRQAHLEHVGVGAGSRLGRFLQKLRQVLRAWSNAFCMAGSLSLMTMTWLIVRIIVITVNDSDCIIEL